MRKRRINRTPRITIISLFLTVLFAPALWADVGIRDYPSYRITRYIWSDNYYKAVSSADSIVESEPLNPVGYFLLGTIYQTISEVCRTDRFKDSVVKYLNEAIELANEREKNDPDNPDWPFITGASHGYRALYRALHGNWWGAFNDGFKCRSHLNHCLELDSSFYDAYVGLGAYHYWSTVKAKDFLWLPFIPDRREQGMTEIHKAADSGYLASYNANETLLRIYLTEKRYNELINLADSLTRSYPYSPYCLLYYTEGLIGINQLDEAEEKLRMLRAVWKKSPYFDPFGFYEAELLSAKIYLQRGDSKTANEIANKIIDDKIPGGSNAFFMETLDKAEALLHSLR
ncbi:MAG: hypothetical protein NTV06_09380 [candidate division Zixibacteria bacterium]|nr:hypothetical protein [candidate division Zixibacteria bacterium]